MSKILDDDSIRVLIYYLRDSGAPAFHSSRYTADIDPWLFATPLRRGIIWESMARIVALDPGYGTGTRCPACHRDAPCPSDVCEHPDRRPRYGTSPGGQE